MARAQVLALPVNRAQHCFKIHQIHIPNVQSPAVALKTRLSIVQIRAARKDYDFTSGTVFRAFMAHIVIGTENRLILWGAKLTCYSVHSLGPHLESLGGSKRFLVVFAVAAVTTPCLSFLMCKSPAVGASGAICGLVRGLMSHEVDNWGHLGGFVGGAFVSWLIGPALRPVRKA
ncbi:hypothetical protein SELMODRAFT_415641 [Selaginella moellendorffii]|uniref:Peptidase S54 rhomboid domain-containing protein n=1 Tax=Selaginella moellendorffii TaxID=88036 RepID=D8RWS5_SELML|nr:hypothetical protein SELMODRAFT_415641 [Selaginella moellendorffii]